MSQRAPRNWAVTDYVLLATGVLAGAALGAGATRMLMRRGQGSNGVDANPESWPSLEDEATSWRPRRRQNPERFEEELEPDENWEVAYQQRFDAALQACRGDERIVSFDQCVISLLERIFPDAGTFMIGSGTGAWKKAARKRARADLTQALGPTEMHARAVLTREVGMRARRQGADVGQAVRTMAEHAWPSANWGEVKRAPWQASFARIASSVIQS